MLRPVLPPVPVETTENHLTSCLKDGKMPCPQGNLDVLFHKAGLYYFEYMLLVRTY